MKNLFFSGLIILALSFCSISCERLPDPIKPSARTLIGSAEEVTVTVPRTFHRKGLFESGATRWKITFDQTECYLLEFVDPKKIETGTRLKGILVEETPFKVLKHCYILEVQNEN